MRLVWLLMATIVLTAGLSAQADQTTTQPAASPAPVKKAAPADPKALALLQQLRKVLGELKDYGKAAARPVTTERRGQKLAPAKAFLRFVEKKLGKMPAPAPAPDAAQVTATARKLSELTVEFVGCAGKGLAVAKQAVNAATDPFERAALVELHKQLYGQIVLVNIAEYDNSGTFDGMFEKSEAFGKNEAADAFLRVYLDLDQAPGTRNLAGEGVAQLGSKRHQEPVRAVYEDPFEEKPIKDKAKEILARLGDMTLINKDLEGLQANLKEESAKLEKLQGEMNALHEQAQAASGADATEEQKAGLKGLQESIQKKQRELVETTFRVGFIHNQIAFVFQGVRLNAKTEQAYRKCLDHWLRIGNLLFRDPNHRGRVGVSWYNLACVQSLQKKVDDALVSIENSFRWGYTRFDWAMKDGDLRNLRNEQGEKFEKLIAEVKSGEAAKRWRKEAEERNKEAEPEGKAGGEKPDGDS